MTPASLVAALAFDRVTKRRTAIAFLVGIGLVAGTIASALRMDEQGNARDVERLTALVERHRGAGCLYVADSIPVLYVLTHSCLPTRFVFPVHLSERRYADALGSGQLDELAKLLGRRPTVVVTRTDPPDPGLYSTRAWLDARLGQDYRLVGTVRTGKSEFAVHAIR